MTGRFQPCGIPAAPSSSGERVQKKKKKNPNTCSLDDHMNNVRMSCKTNTPALGPSGQMKQQSRNSCLQKWFRRNLVTKSKLLNSNTSVVNETRAVLSTSLIRAVYQIELSAVSIGGPVHYECPASTILVRILQTVQFVKQVIIPVRGVQSCVAAYNCTVRSGVPYTAPVSWMHRSMQRFQRHRNEK